MSGMAVLENVRRYRTNASLCRQTAAFRPAQKWTLLAQAYEWERLATTELEAHFILRYTPDNRYGSRHLLRGAHRRIAAAKEHIDTSFDDLRSPFPIGAAPKSSNFKISTFEEALTP
jgi:hypothetical protein